MANAGKSKAFKFTPEEEKRIQDGVKAYESELREARVKDEIQKRISEIKERERS